MNDSIYKGRVLKMKRAKMNSDKDNRGKATPRCTGCNKAIATYNYYDFVRAMHVKFCPNCGAKIDGIQVEGVDFADCDSNTRDWVKGRQDFDKIMCGEM
jgi:predicted RNA-binding Zn-ribbon protein involved in translation (DUF1610 family)